MLIIQRHANQSILIKNDILLTVKQCNKHHFSFIIESNDAHLPFDRKEIHKISPGKIFNFFDGFYMKYINKISTYKNGHFFYCVKLGFPSRKDIPVWRNELFDDDVA